jgi:hypothetical protein
MFCLYFVVTFPTKKVEAGCDDGTFCSLFDSRPLCGGGRCSCYFYPLFPVMGNCQTHALNQPPIDDKKVEESPFLCHSHADCMEKGSGSYCALNPNNAYNINYGWCFASKHEAEDYIKIVVSRHKIQNDILKMPASAVEY